jgi:predicted AAA+ superfamily ATPase
MREIFKQIIVQRQDWLRKIDLHVRKVDLEINANYVFTGLRRAGKTYYLYQIIQSLIKKNNVDNILFINFEDERLIGMNHLQFNEILLAYKELYDLQPILFLDEIQNIEHWQKFARRLADDGYRVYITGSNADMLSSEIASTLGGRYINKEILPLSFNEFLSFQKKIFSSNALYSDERIELKKQYLIYLEFGGFPELLNLENKRDYLSSVYQKLFYGDLIARYKISNPNLLKFLIKKLAESVNNETSVNRIKNLIKSTGINIGSNTLFDYLNYLESSFLIAPISNYYSKFVEKETNKKYYFLDTGILMLFLNDQDTKLLENQIYIELRRRGFSPYFLKSKLEIDFYVPEENLLIQVSYTISDPETRKREIKALESAMKSLEIIESLIITIDEREIIETSSGKIKVIPAFEWLMKSSF